MKKKFFISLVNVVSQTWPSDIFDIKLQIKSSELGALWPVCYFTIPDLTHLAQLKLKWPVLVHNIMIMRYVMNKILLSSIEYHSNEVSSPRINLFLEFP